MAVVRGWQGSGRWLIDGLAMFVLSCFWDLCGNRVSCVLIPSLILLLSQLSRLIKSITFFGREEGATQVVAYDVLADAAGKLFLVRCMSAWGDGSMGRGWVHG